MSITCFGASGDFWLIVLPVCTLVIAAGRCQTCTPALQAKILNATRKAPPDGSTHWSTRKLAKHLGVSHMMVARVWGSAKLRPHRMRRYMLSDDPAFENKAADIIGLYLKPPQHAAVFCVDEKTAIQALDRLDPVLPLSPGRAERHGFEYYRHGTLSLYAAFNTATGEVLGKTTERHTSEQFVAFLADIVATQPRRRHIHIIADNLSAHKTIRVRQFMAAHRRVHIHYTPTYSSWLNQVEIWFSKIERDVIARGIFTSVNDLKRKIMRYIDRYNTEAKPFKWIIAMSITELVMPIYLLQSTRSSRSITILRTGAVQVYLHLYRPDLLRLPEQSVRITVWKRSTIRSSLS